MRFGSVIAIPASLVDAACGTDAPHSPPIDITIAGGQPFTIAETVSVAGFLGPDGQENPNPTGVIRIWMGSRTGLCDDLENNVGRKNSRRLVFTLWDGNTNVAPSLIATYNVVGGGLYGINATVEDRDATCRVTQVSMAVSGSVRIDALTSDNRPYGYIDLAFSTGDHLMLALHSDETCPKIGSAPDSTCL